MRQHPKFELDEIDLKIIEELSRDGRIPLIHLANMAGISQRAASARMKRILDERIVKVVAVPDQLFSKQSLHASVGINITQGHSIHAVAEKLASYPNFRSVAVSSGPYDILTRAFFRSLISLSAFLKYEIGKISAIKKNEVLIHIKTIKDILPSPIREASPDKYKPSMQKRKGKKRYIPDNMDISIIREFQKDGRMPLVDLVKKLGVSTAARTAKRLQRLLSEGIIKVIAVTEQGAHGYELTSMIGLKIRSGAVDEVANKLALFCSVHFLAITLGRYNILLGVHFSGVPELSEFIKEDIGKIPDITRVDNMIDFEIVRNSWLPTSHRVYF